MSTRRADWTWLILVGLALVWTASCNGSPCGDALCVDIPLPRGGAAGTTSSSAGDAGGATLARAGEESIDDSQGGAPRLGTHAGANAQGGGTAYGGASARAGANAQGGGTAYGGANARAGANAQGGASARGGATSQGGRTAAGGISGRAGSGNEGGLLQAAGGRGRFPGRGGAGVGGGVSGTIDPYDQIGIEGQACSPNGATACTDHASSGTLVCAGGVWVQGTACDPGYLCDTTPGNGICQPVPPECAGAQSDTQYCVGQVINACGPDLVGNGNVAIYCEPLCLDGACAGVCTPGETQCNGNGSALETCDATGEWGAPVACDCLAGVCGVDLLIAALDSATNLRVDATNLYWVNAYDSNLGILPLGGGPVLTLPASHTPGALTLDSTSLYWTESDRVMKAAIVHGSPTLMTDWTVSANSSIAVDATNVYWTSYTSDGESDCLMKLPLAGGTPEMVLDLGSDRALALAADATHLYYATDYYIGAIPTAGGAKELLATFPQPVSPAPPLAVPSQLVVDATTLYLANWGSYYYNALESYSGVWSIPLAGGTPTPLFVAPATSSIAVSDGIIYCSGDSITSVATGGGATVPIITPGNQVGSLAADATNVYFVTSGGDNLSAIFRIRVQ
jgi:hypothetical protein